MFDHTCDSTSSTFSWNYDDKMKICMRSACLHSKHNNIPFFGGNTYAYDTSWTRINSHFHSNRKKIYWMMIVTYLMCFENNSGVTLDEEKMQRKTVFNSKQQNTLSYAKNPKIFKNIQWSFYYLLLFELFLFNFTQSLFSAYRE